MLPLDEALNKILSNVYSLGSEKVSILDALGRVISEDIQANRDIPPLDNSAMDGYALRFEDVQKGSSNNPIRLEVIEDLPAGFISKKKLEKGKAIRIMTGAPIPKGADTVIPVEETKKENGSVLIFKADGLGENIRKSGEDVRKGDRVISKGDMIRPAGVGMLASVGRSYVWASAQRASNAATAAAARASSAGPRSAGRCLWASLLEPVTLQGQEISAGVVQPVRVVDPEAGDLARGDEIEDEAVRVPKDCGDLRSDGGQLVDVEEPPVVDLLPGHSPVGQTVVLLVEEPVEEIEAPRIAALAVERAQGLVETCADGGIRLDQLAQAATDDVLFSHPLPASLGRGLGHAAFKEVLRLFPDNQYALLYLEKLHEEQHQWDEAYRIRRQLVDLSGPDTHARSQAILGFLENALGMDALKAQRTEEAARHFASAIDLEPSTTPAYLKLGDVKLLAGDAAGAVATWQRLMDVAPERAHLALERLERLYEQQGTPQRYEEEGRRFIDARTQDWRARLALGSHLSRRGQPAEAFGLLIDALERNPHGLTVHQAVWTVLLQLDLDRTLVQRYIEAARGAVFFLDPHICLKCHYRSTELLWQCPHCHEWNSFVEERIAAARQTSAEM